MYEEIVLLIGIAPNLTRQFIERVNHLGSRVIIFEEKEDIEANKDKISEAWKIFPVETLNYECLKKNVEKLNKIYNITGIITFRDYYTYITSKLIKDFNMKYGVSPEIVNICNNKYLSRKRIKDTANIINTKYKLCKNKSEVKNFLDEVNGDIVIKPLRGKGSIGVYKISSYKELDKFYDECSKLDKKKEGILAEEFINGKELAFEIFVSDGKAILYGISQKHMFNGTFIASGYTTLVNIDKNTFKRYELLMQIIVHRFGIDFGPVLVEGFEVSEDEFYFCEIHTRYAGEHIFEITEKAEAIDILTPIIEKLTNKTQNMSKKKIHKELIAGSRAIYTNEGIIKKIYGMDIIKKIPGVEIVELFYKEGDKVRKLKTSLDRMGWIVAYGKDENELNQIFNEVFLKLYIEMEK